MTKRIIIYQAAIGSCFILLAACSFIDNKTTIHPDYKRLPSDTLINFSFDLKKISQEFLPVLNLDRQLQHSIKIGTDSLLVNDYSGILPYQFEIDNEGNIYIIQWKTSSINVYDSFGNFKYSIGKAGSGPGEFLKLTSFNFNSDFSKLYILDWPDVEVYKKVGNRYVYEDSFMHNLMFASSICSIDDYLFISGFVSKTINGKNIEEFKSITRFDLSTFKYDTSFGFEYIPSNNVINFKRILSETFLACNESSKTVVGQLKNFPFMFGYDLDGNKKWVSKIENFRSTEFTETSEPRLSHKTNEDIYNVFYPFRNVSLNNYELIQIGQSYPGKYIYEVASGNNPTPLYFFEPRYLTILVNSENGALSASSIYDLIGAYRNSTLIKIAVQDSTVSPDNTFYVEKF